MRKTGAQWNWMEITPPLWNFDGYENNSGYPNNVFVQIPQNVGNSTHSSTSSRKKSPRDEYHQVLVFEPFDDGPAKDIERALETIHSLLLKGLITSEEYAKKRAEILARI